MSARSPLSNRVTHPGIVGQQRLAEETFRNSPHERWAFHDTNDPLVRYLRDRRIRIAVSHLLRVTGGTCRDLDALVVCGGVGGEGTLLANLGFRSVTVSDFSDAALAICNQRDPRLATRKLNAEQLDVADNSYDVVLVQDGLHHLPRPVLGYVEMLRVARRAVIVIEPHSGFVARLFGTKWERHGTAVNWVFRWNRNIFEQVTHSYLLDTDPGIRVLRLWDHSGAMARIGQMVGGKRLGLTLARALYGCLNALLWWLGNAMIGLVVKHQA